MNNGKKLPLVEEFYTIQGEGYNTGKPAYFIRIGGCDIGCSWCDTRFSWNPDLHPMVKTDEIIKNVLNSPARSIVVTGGEPLMSNLDYLCSELKKQDVETFIETSGAYPLTGIWDWICLSPKKNAPPQTGITEKANELKVIIQSNSDFQWAETYAEKVNPGTFLYLQPEWSQREKVLPLIIEYAKNKPKWRISIQSHKYMHIP